MVGSAVVGSEAVRSKVMSSEAVNEQNSPLTAYLFVSLLTVYCVLLTAHCSNCRVTKSKSGRRENFERCGEDKSLTQLRSAALRGEDNSMTSS